jgi:hypothetical protein
MPCIIALIVFSIMGIFSASHRALAKEAFSCVFKRITFRPCDTGFQEKIKGKILSKLIIGASHPSVRNFGYDIVKYVFAILSPILINPDEISIADGAIISRSSIAAAS